MADRKQPPARLSTLIRQVYSDLKKSGETRVLIHRVVDEITKSSPELVAQEKERLFHESISAQVRRILKSHSDSLRSTQLYLPLDLGPVNLPVCIAIRSPRKKSGEAEWIELFDVSFNELTQEITNKTSALKQNSELQSLERLREYLTPHMAANPDDPIGPVLARLAMEQAKLAEVSAA